MKSNNKETLWAGIILYIYWTISMVFEIANIHFHYTGVLWAIFNPAFAVGSFDSAIVSSILVSGIYWGWPILMIIASFAMIKITK